MEKKTRNRKKGFTKERLDRLLNSPVYDDEMMNAIIRGIAQNIYLETEKQGLSMATISDIANIDSAHLSRIFNGKGNIGLNTLIKLSYVLNVNPGEFMPFDENKRKTDGQRFEIITRELDLASCNFLLNLCVEYAKEYRRIIHKFK